MWYNTVTVEEVNFFTAATSTLDETEVKSMAGENKKSEYRNAWIAEKLDRVNLTMPKGQKDIVKAHAESQGESLNAFINRAISETMERDNAQKKIL